MSGERINPPSKLGAPSARPINWLKFFAFLLSPAIFSPLLIAFHSNASEALGACVALGGSMVVGLVCAVRLAHQLTAPEKSLAWKAWTGDGPAARLPDRPGKSLGWLVLLLTVVFAALSLGFCYLGCSMVDTSSFYK